MISPWGMCGKGIGFVDRPVGACGASPLRADGQAASSWAALCGLRRHNKAREAFGMGRATHTARPSAVEGRAGVGGAVVVTDEDESRRAWDTIGTHLFDRFVGGEQDRWWTDRLSAFAWRSLRLRLVLTSPSLGAHFARCRFVLAESSLVFFVNRAVVAPFISIAILLSVPAGASCARLIRATFFDTRPWSCTLPSVV
jgi:hypothetical protein